LTSARPASLSIQCLHRPRLDQPHPPRVRLHRVQLPKLSPAQLPRIQLPDLSPLSFLLPCVLRFRRSYSGQSSFSTSFPTIHPPTFESQKPHHPGMNDSPLPPFPGPVLPPPVVYSDPNPPIFDIAYVTPDPSSTFPLVVVAGNLPPEVSDIGRIIHTEPNWQVLSGWANLGQDLSFQVSICRPVHARFFLRFTSALLGCAMSRIHHAGGFTFAHSVHDSRGTLRLQRIITFVVNPDQLIDTLAQLRPTAAV
jgi:hypothetical protein